MRYQAIRSHSVTTLFKIALASTLVVCMSASWGASKSVFKVVQQEGLNPRQAIPNKYQVQINKIELIRNDSKATDILVDGPRKANIASVSSNEQVKRLTDMKKLPAGQYTKVRITMSRDILLNAKANTGSDLKCGTKNQTTDQESDELKENNGNTNIVGKGKLLDFGKSADDVTIPIPDTKFVSDELNKPSSLSAQINNSTVVLTKTLSSPVSVPEDPRKKPTVKLTYNLKDSVSLVQLQTGVQPPGTPCFIAPQPPQLDVKFSVAN